MPKHILHMTRAEAQQELLGTIGAVCSAVIGGRRIIIDVDTAHRWNDLVTLLSRPALNGSSGITGDGE